MRPWPAETAALAADSISLATQRSATVAVAESLTGGLLAAVLTSVPGASAVFRGAVVAYATDVKAGLLGVPGPLLARHGPVHPDVAAPMAAGVRDRLAARVGVATTGVAGPDPAGGQPVGSVFVAACSAGGATGAGLRLAGDREQIRAATVTEALRLLLRMIREETP
jgi:nicotinamide-nucleotide amidase